MNVATDSGKFKAASVSHFALVATSLGGRRVGGRWYFPAGLDVKAALLAHGFSL